MRRSMPSVGLAALLGMFVAHGLTVGKIANAVKARNAARVGQDGSPPDVCRPAAKRVRLSLTTDWSSRW